MSGLLVGSRAAESIEWGLLSTLCGLRRDGKPCRSGVKRLSATGVDGNVLKIDRCRICRSEIGPGTGGPFVALVKSGKLLINSVSLKMQDNIASICTSVSCSK